MKLDDETKENNLLVNSGYSQLDIKCLLHEIRNQLEKRPLLASALHHTPNIQIEWNLIASQLMEKRQGKEEEAKWTATSCRRIWKYLAYHIDDTRRDDRCNHSGSRRSNSKRISRKKTHLNEDLAINIKEAEESEWESTSCCSDVDDIERSLREDGPAVQTQSDVYQVVVKKEQDQGETGTKDLVQQQTGSKVKNPREGALDGSVVKVVLEAKQEEEASTDESREQQLASNLSTSCASEEEKKAEEMSASSIKMRSNDESKEQNSHEANKAFNGLGEQEMKELNGTSEPAKAEAKATNSSLEEKKKGDTDECPVDMKKNEKVNLQLVDDLLVKDEMNASIQPVENAVLQRPLTQKQPQAEADAKAKAKAKAKASEVALWQQLDVNRMAPEFFPEDQQESLFSTTSKRYLPYEFTLKECFPKKKKTKASKISCSDGDLLRHTQPTSSNNETISRTQMTMKTEITSEAKEEKKSQESLQSHELMVVQSIPTTTSTLIASSTVPMTTSSALSCTPFTYDEKLPDQMDQSSRLVDEMGQEINSLKDSERNDSESSQGLRK